MKTKPLTVQEAAEIAGVTRQAVYKAVKEGRLVAQVTKRVFRGVAINRSDLDRWVGKIRRVS